MNIADLAKSVLPSTAVASIARMRKRMRRSRVERLPALSEDTFKKIVVDDLQIQSGDTVYIGSSVDQLHLDFPFYRLLTIVQSVIGPTGNVLFPTYPNRSPISSYELLKQGKVFDIRRSPSYTGLLSEFARRQKGAVRSLHPTKSVCAIGPDAVELTRDHPNSPYPYDTCSPYHKLIDYNAKIIGLGIWTEYLSFCYTVDDALKDNPPVLTYHPEVFEAPCIDYDGRSVIVRTYAHNMAQVIHDCPRFVREYIPDEICLNMRVNGMRFFRTDARKLFDEMMKLARRGITIYPRELYSERFLASLND
jgi:aminoglycoside 3-N-acetyltransferase